MDSQVLVHSNRYEQGFVGLSVAEIKGSNVDIRNNVITDASANSIEIEKGVLMDPSESSTFFVVGNSIYPLWGNTVSGSSIWVK